jgi:hypothetical protein
MDRRSGTGQVVDFIHLDIKRKGNVMADKLKAGIWQKMIDILFGAAKKVVHTEHLRPGLKQPFTEMGTDKSRSAGYQYTFLSVHVSPIALNGKIISRKI